MTARGTKLAAASGAEEAAVQLVLLSEMMCLSSAQSLMDGYVVG